MYNVVEDIKECRVLIIESLIDNSKETYYLNRDVTIKTYKSKSTFPITDEYLKEITHVYNNISVESNDFTLIILQDYGQGCYTPEGYEIVPNELLSYTLDANIGWYNGYICLIQREGDILRVFKLKEIPKIDIKFINDKRPWSYQLGIKNKEVHICISINYRDENKSWNDKYYINTNITKEAITSLDNIKRTIDYIYEKSKGNEYSCTEYRGKHFITRDWLTSNGYNLNNGIWKKENIEIKDDLEDLAYFEYKGDYIFFIEDLKK